MIPSKRSLDQLHELEQSIQTEKEVEQATAAREARKTKTPDDHEVLWQKFKYDRIRELQAKDPVLAEKFSRMMDEPLPVVLERRARPGELQPILPNNLPKPVAPVRKSDLQRKRPIALDEQQKNMVAQDSAPVASTSSAAKDKVAKPRKKRVQPTASTSAAPTSKAKPRRKSSKTIIELPDHRKAMKTFGTVTKYASFLNDSRKDILKARTSEHTLDLTSSDSDSPAPVKRPKATHPAPLMQFEGVKALLLVRDQKDQLMTIGSGWLHVQNLVKGGGEIVQLLEEDPTHVICLPDMVSTKPWTLEEVAKRLQKEPSEMLSRGRTRVYCVTSTWIADSAAGRAPEALYEVKSGIAPPPAESREEEVASVGSPPRPQVVKSLDETDSQTTDTNESHSNKPVAPTASTSLLPSALTHSQPLAGPGPSTTTHSLFKDPIQVASIGTSAPNSTNLKGFSDLGRFLEEAREGNDAFEDNDNMIMNYKNEDEYDSQEEEELPPAQEEWMKKKRGKAMYQCERSSIKGENRQNPNEDICQVLLELRKHYETTGDHWRTIGLQKSVGVLRNCNRRIDTFALAKQLPNIGDSTARKIDEIGKTGGLRRIKMVTNEENKYCAVFQGIYGVGHKTAYKWVLGGAKTLDDVKPGNSFGIKLGEAQLIGLKYYDDLAQRIPRTEAEEIYERMKRICQELDPKAYIELMGSYRRGQADCGDVDFIITRNPEDGITHQGLIQKICKRLEDDKILRYTLADPTDWKAIDASFHGLCALPGGKMRRIDILGVPFHELGAALIYFTGNDVFNRSLRLKARHMGYSLNQHALRKGVGRDPKTKLKTTEGWIVASATEQEIFQILGVTWRPPHERQP